MNLFDADGKPVDQTSSTTQTTSTASPDVFADLLKNIKNENGEQKYDNVPKALEGLAHAQNFIPQLKTELQKKDEEIATLREQLSKAQGIEEVVSRLTAQREAQSTVQPTATGGLDETAVLSLLQNVLQQNKAQESAESNIAQVQSALIAKFGDKATEALDAKAAELGTTRQELGNLARQNPKMVLAYFNVQAPAGTKPTTSSVTIPASYKPPVQELARPEKSLLSGSTSKEQAEFMRKIKEQVYAKYNIE